MGTITIPANNAKAATRVFVLFICRCYPAIKGHDRLFGDADRDRG
jgi:hypothetical protein